MFKVVKEHPKVFWTIIILIILVSILSVYENKSIKLIHMRTRLEILRGKIRYLMIHIIMKNLVIMRKRLMKK